MNEAKHLPVKQHSVLPCLVLTVASWPVYRLLRRQVRWSGIPISLTIFHNFFVIHTFKGFSRVNEAEVDVLLEFPCFFYDPMIWAIWSLILLLCLNPVCISGSSWFMYCWSLAWRFLSMTLLAHEMTAVVWQFKNSFTLPFFGIGMKTFLVLWPLLSFTNVLQYWMQHFNSINF